MLKPRTAICLVCRNALFEGEVCDLDPDHDVAALDGDGREQWVTAVWGSRITRHTEARLTAKIERTAAGLGLAGFMFGLGVMSLIIPGVGPAHLLAGAASMGVSWSASRALLGGKRKPFPIGGSHQLAPASTMGPRGTVEGQPQLSAPATGTECIGYALELHLMDPSGDKLMYRDVVTSGFEVWLEGGGIARIPAGRFHFLGPIQQVIDFDNLEMEEYLREADRAHQPDTRFDPLRYNVIFEQVIVPGDRVEIVSELRPVVEAGIESTYREAVPSHLVPIGPPVVRLLSGV